MQDTRSGMSRKAWALLRRLGGANKRARTHNSINPNLVAQRIVKTSKAPSDKIFTRKAQTKYKLLRKRTGNNSELSASFSLIEIDTAISQMKSGKAAGFDGIYPEFVIHSGVRVRKWLAGFFTDLLERNKIPSLLKESKIIAVLKPGKADHLPESYRPIALLSVTLKLLERVILNRIGPLIEKVIPKDQAGFMKGRSCTEQVLSLTNYRRRLSTKTENWRGFCGFDMCL